MIRTNIAVLCLVHEARDSSACIRIADRTCLGRPRCRTCRVRCRRPACGDCSPRAYSSVAHSRQRDRRWSLRRLGLLAGLLLSARLLRSAAGVLVLLPAGRGLLPVHAELSRCMAIGSRDADPIFLLTMATKPEPANEIKVDPNALYLEEVFTDRRVGTIRRMTPVNKDGVRDQA